MNNETLTQGAKANKTGKIFEDMMIPLFEGNGYSIFYEKEIEKNPSLLQGVSKYVVRNSKYTTIYNHTGRTEFVIYNVNQERSIRVENKHQGAPGSVDEKYVYTLMNALLAYPEKEAIIVFDGGGWKKGCLDFLQTMIDDNWFNHQSHIKVKIMSVSQFINFVNNNLKY